MAAPPDDRSTTPPALQVPVLLGLAALAAYFAVCFAAALDEGAPVWTKWGNWQMFTVGGSNNSRLAAEARYGEAWEELDLLALFPSRFDSGPRWRQLRNRPGQGLRILADSACDRDPRGPVAIRLFDVRWPIVPGEDPHLEKKAKRKQILEWRCSQTAPRPKGRLL